MNNIEPDKGRFVKTEAGKRLSQLLGTHYTNIHLKAQQGGFVVWVAIIVPIEIFSGFKDIVVVVPESHSAMCAGKGVGVQLAEKAEAIGYSMDLCSYARIDIGAFTKEGRSLSPMHGLPRPDLIISNTNNCSLLAKWFDTYHRELGVPHLILDVPFCYQPQQAKDTDYILEQFKAIIEKIEEMTGQKWNPALVQEAVQNTNLTHQYWKEYLAFAKHRPSGITAFDTFVQMAPYINFRGDPRVTEHYKLLIEETKDRVANGIFPVNPEKYRILWDNIAPWHQLHNMSERLKKLNANIVHATYTSCIGTIEGGFELYPYNGSDPLNYLARIQNLSVCPYGLQLREKAMSEIIENIGIDGIVFASNRSCKVYSTMQMDLMRRITEKHNIPAVMIEVDHADVRKYNEENAFVRVEAQIGRAHV